MTYLDHAATTPMLAESIAAMSAELAKLEIHLPFIPLVEEQEKLWKKVEK